MAEADETLVANERTKLSATWFNSISVAAIAVGGIGPLVGVVTGAVGLIPAAVLIAAWFIVGVALHLWARHLLGRLHA